MTDNQLKGNILITGGTGSLGKAILRRAHEEEWDAQFTVMSRDEGKQSHLKGQYPNVKFFLGDVRDLDRLRLLLRNQHTVIHAAAYKQVPSSQVNVSQTMEVNVRGSYNVIQASLESRVDTVIGISTDKAAKPVNAYGASKSMMEAMFQEANSLTVVDTQKFTLTRYGNVIGSRGSVIPFFINQIESGHDLTITDWAMTRFWITLNQAVDLVIEAAHVGPGVIVVPKAPAMRISELAALLRQMYHSPGAMSAIDVRPGEKIHECMVTSAEARNTISKGNRFYIWPPTSNKRGNLAEGYAYTSDIAPTMSSNAMWDAIKEWQKLDG